MRRRLLALFVLLAAVRAGPVAAGDLAVIVSKERSDRPTIAEVAQIFLKQRRFWSDGGRIVPVNRESGSVQRIAFDDGVFGPRVKQLPVYWNRQYFRGVLPPATLASDEAVKRFVASEPEAIGYVDPTAVDDSVSIVLQLSHP